MSKSLSVMRVGAALAVVYVAGAALGDPPLDPMMVPKYAQPLVVPPAMPKTATITIPGQGVGDYYEIGVRQFRQQVLPPGLPETTVWGYGSITHPGTFNYPAFTIEAKWRRPVRVKWVNELVDESGNFLPHLLPVDPTLHWANPPGGESGRDSTPSFLTTPGPYEGPVPIVSHVHGAKVGEESDGFTEAWYLPAASDIPAEYARVGSYYDEFHALAIGRWGTPWEPGSATFTYPNRQPAGTIWYHDHALGMTRLNVYAGMAGFYLLRGGPNDETSKKIPSGAYEVPLAIQDRSFTVTGALRYAESRAEFDGFDGPFIPDSDISPIWNPEFFGDTIVVNGRVWPSFNTEARRYRLRLLNGCDSRFLVLKLVGDPSTPRPAMPAIPFTQIGTDVAFLNRPVVLDQIVLGPGERADVVVDFSMIAPGSSVYLINEGPDEPYGGGVAGTDFEPANPETTGQVMRFDVVAPTSADTSLPAPELSLPAPKPTTGAAVTRRVALMELDSDVLPDVGPRMAVLGTIDEDGVMHHAMWDEPVTEVTQLGQTEIWEIHNLTMDAHPIHLHAVGFSVIDRMDMMTGEIVPAPANEQGLKDTVIAFPDQVTRIRVRFEIPGLFVWHCHILSHEDNEMMRPLLVSPGATISIERR